MNEGYLNPNSFGFMRSVDFVVMVTLGGLNSVWGAVIAAIVLTVLPEKLRFLNQYRMIIYSVLLIAMMQLRGGGWKRIAALFGGGPRSPRGLAVTPPDAPPHVGGGAAV
jgi:ABC-type branched-subunit amino acid transport system permease subunit